MARGGPRRYTDEQNDFLRSAIPGRSWRETADLYEERFGVRLTRSQVKNARKRLGVAVGRPGGRFEPGHPSPTKGRPMEEWMPPEGLARLRAARFQPGHVPAVAERVPLGSERVRCGYVWVKVAASPSRKEGGCGRTNDNWRPKHHLVWEREHGRAVPEGHVVAFADGDPRNFDPENLVLAEKAAMAVVNRAAIPYCDADTLRVALAAARVKIAGRAAQRRVGARR